VRAVLTLCVVLLAAPGCSEPGGPPPYPAIRPASIGYPGWKVTRRYSAHRVLVVEGECRDREHALAIAQSIVEDVTEAYDEVLVYVRPGGGPGTRRIQWRKTTGKFETLDF
jgi:hypothetical protein